MKRKEIEGFFKKIGSDVKAYVHANPLQAFFIGIAGGFVLALLRGLIIPFIFIVALIAVVLWLLAEQEPAGIAGSPGTGSPNPGPRTDDPFAATGSSSAQTSADEKAPF